MELPMSAPENDEDVDPRPRDRWGRFLPAEDVGSDEFDEEDDDESEFDDDSAESDDEEDGDEDDGDDESDRR